MLPKRNHKKSIMLTEVKTHFQETSCDKKYFLNCNTGF